MSKTRFVAFATQKGGIGKSTITALVANYFHNVKGYNVAVIDCDEPQYNLADLRDEELELIKSSDYFKAQACEHFKKLGKKSFSVTRSNAVNALMTQRQCCWNLRLNLTSSSLICLGQSKARVS